MQLMFQCPQGIHAVHAFLKNEKPAGRGWVRTKRPAPSSGGLE